MIVRPPAPEPSKTVDCVRLQSTLAEDGSLLVLREKDRKLVYYWGRIAYHATNFATNIADPLPVLCRRRPGGVPCESQLFSREYGQESGSPTIYWYCPRCGDEGTLTGWEGTAFDFFEHEGGMLEEPLVLTINLNEWRMLQQLHQPPKLVLSLLFGAQIGMAGGQLTGSRSEFEALYAAFERLCLGARHLDRVSERALNAHLHLHRRLSDFLELRPYKPPSGTIRPWSEPAAPG